MRGPQGTAAVPQRRHSRRGEGALAPIYRGQEPLHPTRYRGQGPFTPTAIGGRGPFTPTASSARPVTSPASHTGHTCPLPPRAGEPLGGAYHAGAAPGVLGRVAVVGAGDHPGDLRRG